MRLRTFVKIAHVDHSELDVVAPVAFGLRTRVRNRFLGEVEAKKVAPGKEHAAIAMPRTRPDEALASRAIVAVSRALRTVHATRRRCVDKMS